MLINSHPTNELAATRRTPRRGRRKVRMRWMRMVTHGPKSKRR
jgi:hypothetical protein